MADYRDVIELSGASGDRYRFKRIADPQYLPPHGGNFVYTKQIEGAPKVIACGASDTLTRAAEFWPKVVDRHGADSIYVRLNVNKQVRLHDHEDLTAAQADLGDVET